MNKEYKIKLDLNKKLYNKKMTFNQFDENVNDFYIEVTKNNEVIKGLNKSIVTLVAIKPDNTVEAQFIEVENGLVYADLKPSMCDLVGNYQAKAMIVLEGEIVTTDTINYSVNEDKIISRLNEDVVSDERFTLFTDALARLSDIEASEEQRIVNESERILSEENRKIEEAKRVEAELIRQHEETDRAKYDATRESNENIRKQNESIRLANETNRIDEEAKRVEEENKRKLAEEERNANYNFMTEDEEHRRSEANAHKEAEVLRVQAETNRVNEEAKRRTTEQARVLAENTRVSNENTREASEVTRQTNETQRVEAETQRQNRYNSFIADAEANASNFENYTNTAKVKEEERKSNELDRKSQEDRRVSNEAERISNENTRKANENARIESEKQRVDAENLRKEKIIEIQSDYDSLKKVIIDENASANLQNQINQTNSQLEHIAINIFDYLDNVVTVNGKEDWKPAFDKAFEDLLDGGTLLIPKHDYYISTRSALENKNNITINCAGKIMPIDRKIPLIGTITLNNLKDCVVNGLNMDGNIDNITYTNTYGTQSLLRMDNCSNIIFNNIKLENTCENGFSSNGNLNNIIFNNVELNGIGEHGFYFGGTNCNNIKFNNITCTDIGLNDSCSSRHCGVIKFRNKQLGDIMHDNIAIDGFNFISNQTDITGHRQLVCGYDVKNLTIKNGTIRGERTSIFSSNISLDNFIIDNVILDGFQIFYGLNKGNDYSAELEQGRMYIAILNSDLYCSSSYNASISLISNSKYKIKEVMDDKMSINGYIRDVVYDNVEFDINEKYFNISKIDRNYEFRNCIFKNKTNTSPLFNLGEVSANEDCKFSLINCLETETHSISVQSNNKFDLSIINSTLKGEIKTLSSQLRNLLINNSNVLRGKIDTYAMADNFILNGIYDLDGKRYDVCVNNATCKSFNTSVNLDLRYQIAKNIDLNKLIITNNKNIPFTVSNSENILTLSTIERQESDTVFSVFYTI